MPLNSEPTVSVIVWLSVLVGVLRLLVVLLRVVGVAFVLPRLNILAVGFVSVHTFGVGIGRKHWCSHLFGKPGNATRSVVWVFSLGLSRAWYSF